MKWAIIVYGMHWLILTEAQIPVTRNANFLPLADYAILTPTFVIGPG